jgi:hypothetical protein
VRKPRRAPGPALLSCLLAALLLGLSTRSRADTLTADEPAADAAQTATAVPAPSAAQADDPDAPKPQGWKQRRSAADTGGEIALAGGQVMIGTLITVASGTIGFWGALYGAYGGSIPLTMVGGALFLSAPALAGLAVCGLGRTSATFTGGCGWTIGGGYLGLLLIFPLAAVMGEESRFTDETVLSPLVMLAGYGMGAALGATIAWHVSKRARPDGFVPQPITRAAPPPAAIAPWTEPLVRPGARNAAAAPQLAVPLLAFAF